MPDITDATIEAIRRAVASINYGSVQITVHDGRVVQIEKSERIRLDQADRKTGSKAG